MEMISPQEAAVRANGQIQLRQIQQVCRLYHETDGARGLRCEKHGTGPRTSYLIDVDDLTTYLASPPKRGWPKGRGRKEKSATSASGGAGEG